MKNSEDRVLILEKDGQWMLPGGRLEENDKNAREGLKRELEEETGLNNVDITGIVDVVISPSGKTFNVIYEALVEGAPKIEISPEHTGYA